jgi:ABC-type xylose transport system permease subunit
MYTIVIAKFLGIFFLVLSLTLFCRKEFFKSVINNIIQHPGLQFIAAIVPLIIGILIISLHNHWTHDLPSLAVTLAGWLLLAGALFRLWFTDAWIKTIERLSATSFVMPGLGCVVMALLFLYIGFM